MRIEETRFPPATCGVGDVEPGDVFRYGVLTFMRLGEPPEYPGSVRAVNLATGTPTNIQLGREVIPLKSRLLVEEV